MQRASERGSALVELAVVLPVLVTILVGTADFARVFYYAMELTAAARAGAQYAAYNSVTVTQIPQITAAAQAAAPNISIAATDVAVTTPCQCAANDGTGAPWMARPCATICPLNTHLVQSVTVQTRKTFRMITIFFPIRSITITRTATMRVAL